MHIYDFKEFLKLSSVLNYNLSAASLNRYNVLLFILGEKKLAPDDKVAREKKRIVMEALDYLFRAYSQKRRRLGPLAVLHPLRATAILARSVDKLTLVLLLSTLFHDILEDIKAVNFETHKWKEMETRLDTMLQRLVPDDEAELVNNLICLTRVQKETYYQYIGRLLDNTQGNPELVQIKLADRLDNTLDMRIELEDPLLGIDFFRNIFHVNAVIYSPLCVSLIISCIMQAK